MKGQRKMICLSVTLLTLLIVACGPSPTSAPPTSVPPTATSVAPTSVPPTATSVPPTSVPPTATPASVAMTVTFTGGTCAMDGPQQVPEGTRLVIDWNLVDKDYVLPGLCLLTVDEGKTLADLVAAPGFPQPAWAHVVGSCWDHPGGGTKTVQAPFLRTGPVYLACFKSEKTKIGVLGPIEVVKYPTATTALAFPTGVFTKANITWEFKADGTYYWKESKSGTDASGVYTVTGDQIVIKDDLSGCQDVAATYVWAYDGQKLSLVVVDDQCRDRRLTFDHTKWTKKP